MVASHHHASSRSMLLLFCVRSKSTEYYLMLHAPATIRKILETGRAIML